MLGLEQAAFFGFMVFFFLFLFFVHTLMHTGQCCIPGETMRLKHILICQFMCRPFVVTHSHEPVLTRFGVF